jgi:hypothetical protein
MPRQRRNAVNGLAAAAEGKLMGRFLDECAEEGRTHVVLGRLPGFPTSTTDPDVIEKAAEEIASRIDSVPSRVGEMRLRQRVKDLRAEAERLRHAGEATEAYEWFVAHGRAWCEREGISYAVLRDMGVPAAYLTEAGIKR